MSAFRTLEIEELEIFRTEFVQFLSSQGITADEWERWQRQNRRKVEDVVNRFSEFIFFSIFEKSNFFEKSLQNGVHYIRFSGKEMSFLAIYYPGKDKGFMPGDLSDCQVMQGKKVAALPLNEEKFGLIKEGYIPVKSAKEDQVSAIFDQIFER